MSGVARTFPIPPKGKAAGPLIGKVERCNHGRSTLAATVIVVSVDLGAMGQMSPRLKREECLRTKHDSLFSKWMWCIKLVNEKLEKKRNFRFSQKREKRMNLGQVLIGPTDWEDYSLGKDGVERYRIHNIPIHSACPGLYELGIASNPGGEDNRTRRHAAEDVIVVYLGQADNVRTRLQQYGRAGAHLDHRNSSTSADKIVFPFTQSGPGLFKEIFSRGHSIMFRWVLMTSKKEAEKTEASLLEVFDYAWNRRGNGVCRREEVLSKLDNAAARPISSAYRKVQHWRTIFDKKEGIKINGSMPLDEVGSSDGRKGFLLEVLKFVTSRPRLVQGGGGIPGDHDICGVAIDGGLVCRNKPVKGRKRCEEHKGKRITGIGKVTSGEVTTTSEKSCVCGFVSEDGSVCSELAIHGTKRCELHKGRRTFESRLRISSDGKLQSQLVRETCDVDREYNICGVVYGDGSICRKKPVSGRKRCEYHKGQRITGTKLLTSEDWMTKKGCNLDEPYDICGVVNDDGYVCKRKPVSGRKRCEEHKGRRVTSPGLMISMESFSAVQHWRTIFDKKEGIKINGSMPLDEVGSSDGRKGFLLEVLKFVTSRPRLVQGGGGIPGDHDICGVAIDGGLVCRNKPVKGRKRCEEHKGKRITGIGKVTSGEVTTTSEKSCVCGFVSEDGSVCSELAIHGTKRCELHKGRRTFESRLRISSDGKLQSQLVRETCDVDREYNICGVVYGDGSICRKKPVSGRKRCEYHKGQRITGTKLLTSEDWMTKKGCNLDEPYDICGVVNDDGYVCKRKPVSGRKRCEEHKGRRVTSPGLMISMESFSAVSRSSSSCGVTLSNGSICMRSPVPGRKRCSLHKGRRIT
ncbi:putative protein EFFECTOR OF TRANSCRIPTION 2 [Cocos nucifera]|uniref:GIY-YIG domain-containing protein n=1 Tax=Cocos nucifera TaxID=13894 RepID=A0A8K0I0T3_COCNU|nr:putative protein EFFECTOR OF TRANSCRIPTION 2 [Cocos nucifera]